MRPLGIAPPPGISTKTLLAILAGSVAGNTITWNLPAFGSFGGSSYAMQIGNVLGNPPQFAIYGVGAERTLFSYDLGAHLERQAVLDP